MKEGEEENDFSANGQNDKLFQTSNRTKWLLGIIFSVGGIICLIMWGLLSIINPVASNQISESSMISIDGNGIYLILCIVAVIIGAVLLLKNTTKK